MAGELTEIVELLQTDLQDLRDQFDDISKMFEQSAAASLSHRDMIAMTVAAGLTSKYNEAEPLAKEAYAIADALLAERKKALG